MHAGRHRELLDVPADYRELRHVLASLLVEHDSVDTHLHVHKENNLLFPSVLELIGRRHR